MPKTDSDDNRKFSPPRKERRGHLRTGVRVRVRMAGAADLSVSGWVRNISLGGMFVECDGFFPIDSACTVAFSVREGDTLHTVNAESAVRHHAKNGMGLEFCGLAPEHRKIIKRLVAGDFPAPAVPRPE